MDQDRVSTSVICGILGALIAAALVSFGGWTVLFWMSDFPQAGSIWKLVRAEFMSHIPFVSSISNEAKAFADWVMMLPKNHPFRTLQSVRQVLAVAGFLAGFWLFYRMATRSDGMKHIRGRRLLEGPESVADFKREAIQEVGNSGEGIRIHPSLSPIAIDRETRHFLIVGSVGSGKTQTILPMMLAAGERQDHRIIFDNKGDFSSKLPSDGLLILAPWDARSPVWHVSADVKTSAQAKEFASRIIPEAKGSSSPMWTNAARQVLTGCVVELQATRPGAWGFGDLKASLIRPATELKESFSRHFPEAIKAVEGENVTTSGIIINLMAALGPVFDLALAWPSPTPGNSFSVMNFLHGKSKYRTIILPGHGQFQGLARAFAGAIIGLASQWINSPACEDSDSRKLWFFLDEFPQLGKIEAVLPLLEIGRSKGIRVVIGLQDLEQMREVYGDQHANSVASMVGTTIVCRVNAGDTAATICEKWIGEREVEKLDTSQTRGAGAPAGVISDGGTTSNSWKRTTTPVMLPAELSSRLGARKDGVNVLFLGYANALILRIPFTTLPKLRASCVESAWTSHPFSTTKSEAEWDEFSRKEETEKKVETTEIEQEIKIIATSETAVENLTDEAGKEIAVQVTEAVMPGSQVAGEALDMLLGDGPALPGEVLPEGQETQKRLRLRRRGAAHEPD